MTNISDIIEQFILEQLDEFGEVSLSRNELANYFNCAPSQINYVLSTRFTNPRGYFVESRRGGGGYIKLIRLDMDGNDYIDNLITTVIQNEISYNDATNLVDGLFERGLLTEREVDIIQSVINNKTLSNPIKMEDRLRANILKNILISIIKGGD